MTMQITPTTQMQLELQAVDRAVRAKNISYEQAETQKRDILKRYGMAGASTMGGGTNLSPEDAYTLACKAIDAAVKGGLVTPQAAETQKAQKRAEIFGLEKQRQEIEKQALARPPEPGDANLQAALQKQRINQGLESGDITMGGLPIAPRGGKVAPPPAPRRAPETQQAIAATQANEQGIESQFLTFADVVRKDTLFLLSPTGEALIARVLEGEGLQPKEAADIARALPHLASVAGRWFAEQAQAKPAAPTLPAPIEPEAPQEPQAAPQDETRKLLADLADGLASVSAQLAELKKAQAPASEADTKPETPESLHNDTEPGK